MSVAELRLELVAAARRLEPLGLTQGTSGNLSARTGDGMLVTPSALAYAAMGPDDLVLLDLDGGVHGAPALGFAHRPSTEWRMHAGILRDRPDVAAIVHAHPPWATALSCLRRGIPAFHYMVAVAGGDRVECAEYATFGTGELAAAAVEALGDRRACLLANHGIIACGATVESALGLAVEVEALAGQYMRALPVGEPTLLDEDEMARVLEAFKGYGR